MMLGPFPRSLARLDGGVAAATTYLSQALCKMTDIELIGVRVAGVTVQDRTSDDLGWPVVDLDLGRFSVSTLFQRQLRRFRRLVRQYRPDLIHAQGADAAGFLAVQSGFPSIVTIHGLLSECARYRTSLLGRLREVIQARLTERFVVERSAHVIAISPYVASYYKDRLRGIIYNIPNPVAPAFFGIHRRPEQGRFLFAGRVSSGKGLSDLVSAVARIRNARAVTRVVVAGAVPEREYEVQLKAEINAAKVGDQFELAGLLEEPALLREFEQAEALILPSYQETAPMVVQQAMAAGVPVIATRVGGIPHMIEHGVSGMLVEPGR